MASSIAASLIAVGLVVNRVSMVADTLSPAGAGPVRSVNTPTTPGRRFGSLKPLRRYSEPCCAESSSWSAGAVLGGRPTKVANVPASVELISIR